MADPAAAPDFSAEPFDLARSLIGATLLVDGVGGVIVETEAYDLTDPASHSFSGVTARNAVMFGPPGRLYVYRSYGVHWCANIVCGRPGGAVLLRAIQPTAGLGLMRQRRGVEDERRLCAGPGRLCQALGLSLVHNGADLEKPPFELLASAGAQELICGPRIGISKASERPWRFGLRGSHFLSRPFRGA